ncbi:MAG: hypothetical protein ABFS03_06030 [Chloroflexota bacterium]
MMSIPTVEISSLTKISRRRELPIPGKVLVRQGLDVEAHTVIAEAVLEPEHILIDVARGLNISVQQADKAMQRSDGEMINKGDILAGPIGMTRRVVRAPKAGKIIVAGEGQVLMEADNPPHQLLAELPGLVTALIPNRGAIIETTGAIVQGLWGNGKMVSGLLHTKLQKPGDILNEDQLDVSQRGVIILGGHCSDAKVLQKAAEIPLKGLIITSMTSNLIPLAEKMSFPIIVLEGFGKRRLNTISYNILMGNINREIVINAKSDSPGGTRPEIIIPLQGSSELTDPLPDIDAFIPGQLVRVTREPYAAQTGTIVTILHQPIAFPSGLFLPAANITVTKNEEQEQITVPLPNLEVIV